MLIALVATVVLLEPTPVPTGKATLSEPLTALRHRALATTSGVGLLYNWGFFTLLGYAPFLMGGLDPISLGAVFFGWGLFVAVFAVFGAPWLRTASAPRAPSTARSSASRSCSRRSGCSTPCPPW